MMRVGSFLVVLFPHEAKIPMCDDKFIRRWHLKIYLLGADGVSFSVAVHAKAIIVCITVGIATQLMSSTRSSSHVILVLH